MNIKNTALKSWIGALIIIGGTYGSYLSFSNYLVPFSERSGISVTSASMMFTFLSISTLLGSLVFGDILKKVRVKILIPIAALLFSSVILALGYTDNVTVLYITAFLAGFGQVFIGFPMGQVLIMWWCDPKTMGVRLNSLSTALAIAAFFANPLIAKSIVELGVQRTALLHAAIAIAFIGLIGGILAKERPERYGVALSYGEEEGDAVTPEATSFTPLSVVLRTYPFWLLMICTVVVSVTFGGYANNASPFYQSYGLTPVQAAFCISIVSGGQAFTAPLFGILLDKFGLAKAVGCFSTVAAIGFFCSRFITGYSSALVFAVVASCFAFINFIATVGFQMVYPKADTAKLIGYGNAASQVGNALAAPVAAIFFTRTGSYQGFMTLGACLMIVAIVMVAAATGKKAVETVENKEK